MGEKERYDRMPLYAEALNTQLGRYEDELKRRAAEAASARARYSSGGSGGSSGSSTKAPLPGGPKYCAPK